MNKKITLEHAKPSYPVPGVYQLVVAVTSGSVTLEIPGDDGVWQPMSEGVFASGADATMTITDNGVRASISGVGSAYLRRTGG